ncbi:spindle and centriole-associated protein 1 isoform X2 [Tachyglossus aculeatus]|uniref:spindle and centriole-associated protein 1 isoform X2 n=1 Tax=Tachyglossus aculeatus TaxID=9261 RepID=UPI0018F6427F|nr:spindle and centriole-associated protein 1 isoform X2 [Tachyglossus aculeatus]
MSFVRGSRPFGPRAGGRKVVKVKRKKPSLRQEWDSTVSDLSVHRATPEDLVRRHELHKSRNRSLVHGELQEKALKKKQRKQKLDTPDLGNRRLVLMREILSDQYQMHEVLERSDQAMAVAKNLFGDAPRRRTGFPNVTMAPTCVGNPDPSNLNEAAGNPQAASGGGIQGDGEGTIVSFGEGSESEQDGSLSFQSSANAARLLRHLKEENSAFVSQLWRDAQLKKGKQSPAAADAAATPSVATCLSPERTAALNATNVVQRVRSRLQAEEPAQSPDSASVVRRVLNPNPRKQKKATVQGKRNPGLHAPSKQKSDSPSRRPLSCDPSSGPPHGPDVLKLLTQEVQREMEDYERLTGREVQSGPESHGLSGFTLSLVSALCRLVRYLKESELRLKEEVESRRRLEGTLKSHRELIDALTAELLLLREESATLQVRLPQPMTMANERLPSLTRAAEDPAGAGSGRGPCSVPGRDAGLESTEPRPEALASRPGASKPTGFRGEGRLELAQREPPTHPPQWPNCDESTGPASRLLTAHMCEPAVMLTPPRQSGSLEFSPPWDALRGNAPARPTLWNPPKAESAGPTQEERMPPSKIETQHLSEGSPVIPTQSRQASFGEEGPERSPRSPSVSPSQSHRGPHFRPQPPEEPVLTGSTLASGVGPLLQGVEDVLQSRDLVDRIAELTLQNSALKAQLGQWRGPCGEPQNSAREPVMVDSAVGSSEARAAASLEERIAELNWQSAEARGKLLRLIEQQRLGPLSPGPSLGDAPLPPPLVAWTAGGKRTIEVCIPGLEMAETSTGETPSPGSGTTARRLSRASSSACSPASPLSGTGKFTPWTPKTKVGKPKEEGWFALSTHVT